MTRTKRGLHVLLGSLLMAGSLWLATVCPEAHAQEADSFELQEDLVLDDGFAGGPSGEVQPELPSGLYPGDADELSGASYEDSSRIVGADRFGTAINGAYCRYLEEGNVKHQTVVFARGGNFPDALSGGYLCLQKSAPLLLVDGGHEALVIDYLEDCAQEGATVYLLGGTSVVSQSFEETLVSKGYVVKRLAGPQRYATNLAVLRETAQDASELVVASGKNFPDALSGSNIGKPMLLANDTLSATQLEWLEQSGIKKFYILGGTSAVSSTVERQLAEYGSVERVGGKNRWDTSYQIARRFFGSSKTITVATGKNFPDALSGAHVAALFESPLVLVSNEAWSHARSFVTGQGVRRMVCIGGTKAVSDATLSKIMYGTRSRKTLTQAGVKANNKWKFFATVSDAQIDELLYNIEGFCLTNGGAEFRRPIEQCTGFQKVTAVLSYIGATYSYGDSWRGSDMVTKGSGTCFAFSELVYCCLKKLGLSCWCTVPGRHLSSQVPGVSYGTQHRSVVVVIDGKYYEADGNLAIYRVEEYGYAEPFEISTAYANYLTGVTNTFNG